MPCDRRSSDAAPDSSPSALASTSGAGEVGHRRHGSPADIGAVIAAVSTASLALLSLGIGPASAPAVALAAVAPRLVIVDLREHRLPNRMVVPVLALGTAVLVIRAILGESVVVPAVAALVFGGLLLALAVGGGMGMGDVKLAAVIGLASPDPILAFTAPVAGILLGGIASTIALARGGRDRRIAFGPYLIAGWAVSLAAGLALRAW